MSDAATAGEAAAGAGRDFRSTLVARFSRGDQRALAQAISIAERGEADGRALVSELFGRSGHARVYGITGAPGAGKSTLVEQFALAFRARRRRVAIVAVDPSSPFTGGALLGDRIRMSSALADGDVYMRSLANRGHLGGLSSAADDVITLLDAFGFEVILVETVGTGQAEVEIMQHADATVVVVVPGLGDYVQAMKAGILEIADIYAINKADRDYVDRTSADLKGMLNTVHMGRPGLNRWPDDAASRARLPVRRAASASHLDLRFGSATPGGVSWFPPQLKTVATVGTGVDAVIDALEEHDTFLRESGCGARQVHARVEARLRRLVGDLATRAVLSVAVASGDLDQAVAAIAERRLDPYSAAEHLFASRD